MDLGLRPHRTWSFLLELLSMEIPFNRDGASVVQDSDVSRKISFIWTNLHAHAEDVMAVGGI